MAGRASSYCREYLAVVGGWLTKWLIAPKNEKPAIPESAGFASKLVAHQGFEVSLQVRRRFSLQRLEQ